MSVNEQILAAIRVEYPDFPAIVDIDQKFVAYFQDIENDTRDVYQRLVFISDRTGDDTWLYVLSHDGCQCYSTSDCGQILYFKTDDPDYDPANHFRAELIVGEQCYWWLVSVAAIAAGGDLVEAMLMTFRTGLGLSPKRPR